MNLVSMTVLVFLTFRISLHSSLECFSSKGPVSVTTSECLKSYLLIPPPPFAVPWFLGRMLHVPFGFVFQLPVRIGGPSPKATGTR